MRQTSLDMEADRLLAILQSDFLLLSRMDGMASDEFRGVIVTNLRNLANTVEMGGVPDAFPVFRHGEGKGG